MSYNIIAYKGSIQEQFYVRSGLENEKTAPNTLTNSAKAFSKSTAEIYNN